jgi:hypothetical protein
MRISFDTQEDSYEDALAVLRRAYGRRGPAPKRDESRSGSEAGKPVAEKRAASRKPNNSAASPSDSRLGSAEAGSARGELSAPPMRQTRSTRESATGKVRPVRGTARTGARKEASSKAAAGKVARVDEAAATSAAAEKVGSNGTAMRKTARRGAPSEPVAERPRRGARKKTSAGPAANVAPPGQSEAVRAWARAQGMPVSDRGRMPASVIAAYEAAHNG